MSRPPDEARDPVRDTITAYVRDSAPDRAARAALVDRILDDRPRRSRQRLRRVGVVAAAGLAAGLAAVAAVALGLRATVPADDTPAEHVLAASPEPVVVQPDVTVWADGDGVATPGHVVWRDGTVRIEVTPNRGVSLDVTTDEAVVRVVGTVFAVDRGLYGTAVTVDRGHVAVTCVGGATLDLVAGQAGRCFPSAETGAGYVVQLQREGAPPSAWLDAVAAARRAPSSGADTPAVLLALEVDALVVGSRSDEAAERLARALRSGEAVLDRSLSAVAAARIAAGDCAGAAPLLDALAARGDADAAGWSAACAAR